MGEFQRRLAGIVLEVHLREQKFGDAIGFLQVGIARGDDRIDSELGVFLQPLGDGVI